MVLLFLLFGVATALQCDIPGECSGEFLGIVSANSSTECLTACKGNNLLNVVDACRYIMQKMFADTQGCMWYIFVPDSDFCSLMKTCTDIDEENCANCISGKMLIK